MTTDCNVLAVPRFHISLLIATLRLGPDCGLLPPLENGNVLAAESTTGAMATYKCNLGYQLIGAGERICQELDGTWSGAAPTCQRE